MPPVRTLTYHDTGHPGEPGLDTGIAHAIVKAVGAGEAPETLRIHRPGSLLAFGRHDTLSPGYEAAVSAARDAGFAPIERLAGGRAAVFHEGTLAFAWAIPQPDPRAGVMERFETISAIMADAFRSLGVDAEVGELPGEYCPGAYSVHAEGRVKIMGVGQRLVRGAAHVGGVVSVTGGSRIREVLVPVYEALGLAWDPSTAGALDEFVPDIDVEAAREAITRSFETVARLEPAPIPDAFVEAGRRLAPTHLSGARR